MLTDNTVQTIKKWRFDLLSKNGTVNQKRQPSERYNWSLINPLPDSVLNEIISYYESGNGYKTIAKELNLTYMECRSFLINWIKINPRKGTNIVTDELRKKRSENAKGSKSNFYNWIEKRPEQAKKQLKSIQGWYLNKNNEKIWLRSSLEYIYAKWLDKNNIKWKTEVKTYTASEKTYRPDFFIYDENNNLIEIVEIKGNYFNNVEERSKKAIYVCEKNNLKLNIIFDIQPYIEKGSYYIKELKAWKQIQKQFAEKSSQSNI